MPSFAAQPYMKQTNKPTDNRGQRFFVLSCLVLLLSTGAVSQNQPPFKTGVALSGGGAKGLAHVGLLQLIDSLEIQVDYLTGTSMGGVLAGFYSIGYSADSIHRILNNLSWEYMLSDNLPLTRVHINEKDNFNTQLVSLPIRNKLPSIPGFMVEGQYLSEALGKLLFPARNITHFHQLPIPLELVSADIVSGTKVMLRQGSLPLAIRASMSIPAIFSPVSLGDSLLVDGGLKRNFPVEELREMGADFVIGSYTGFRKMSEKEMDNAINFIYQSFAIDAVEDAGKMMRQTDILLDLRPSLTEYGTQSFADYKAIIETGKKEARKLLPQLIELKRKQMAAGITYQRRHLQEKQIPIRAIGTRNTRGDALPDAERKYILAVLDSTQMNRLDTVSYLSKKIDELFSHQNYTKIYYAFETNAHDEKQLNLYFKKAPPTLQLSLHYDTYESAGIAMRYNRHDMLLNNSRFSAAVDLSQYFKANVQYLKYLGIRKNVWAKIDYDYRRQKSNDLFFKLVSQTLYFSDPNMYNNYNRVALSMGYSPTISSSVSAGVEYKHNHFNKDVGSFAKSMKPEDKTSEKIQPLYEHSHAMLFLTYSNNTLNKNLYATQGNKVEVGGRFFFNNRLRLNKPNADDKVGADFHSILNPATYRDSLSAYNPVLQLWASEHAVFPVSRKVSLHLKAFAGINFKVASNNLSALKTDDYMFLSQKFNLGGYDNYTFSNHFPFPGLSVNELKINNIAAITLSMQWSAWKKLYITPKVGYALSLGDMIQSDSSGNDLLSLWGGSVDVDYLTLIGPVKFSVSFPFVKPNFFFSLGYQF